MVYVNVTDKDGNLLERVQVLQWNTDAGRKQTDEQLAAAVVEQVELRFNTAE